MLTTLLVFIAILGLLVFIHELGHFLVARWVGVPVEEFAFGFRPRLIGKKIGGTVYAINLIPLGGYVRLLGETGASDDPKAFTKQSAGHRAQVLVAGSVMNLLLGWLLLTILFAVGFTAVVPGVGSNPFIQQNLAIKVTEISAGSPAQLAGLTIGDEIESVNHQPVKTDLEFVSLVNSLKGQLLTVTVKRGSDSQDLLVQARANPPADQGPMGVVIESTGKVRARSVVLAPIAGLYQTGKIVSLSATGFVGFVRDLFIKRQVSSDVTGIVGIGALTGVARRLGLQYLTQLIIVITIGLGVINLMPILPLDGGQLVLVGYEKLVGRKVSEHYLGWLMTAGLAFVLLIFVVVTYKDIIRFNVFQRLF